MEHRANDNDLLHQLTDRLAALEDNVAFLEVWCEEQQDALDRVGETVTYWYFEDDAPEPVRLRVVDLREGPDGGGDESEHRRRTRLLRDRISDVRAGLERDPELSDPGRRD